MKSRINEKSKTLVHTLFSYNALYCKSLCLQIMGVHFIFNCILKGIYTNVASLLKTII